jgi:hypothetical protein
MADEQAVEWVVVKHVRFPLPWDTVLGRYPTELDAINALNAIMIHPQWFTTYAVEKRVKGG